jgi:hypothetical protein
MSRWQMTVASLPYIFAYSSNRSPYNIRTQLDPAMENLSTPFIDLLNSSPSSNPSNSSPQTRQEIPHHIPGYPPPNLHMNRPPQHYGYQPHCPPNFMAFGGQGSYQATINKCLELNQATTNSCPGWLWEAILFLLTKVTLGNTHKHLQAEVSLVVHHRRLVRQLFLELLEEVV